MQDTHQTPPRHLPDTLQTPQNMAVLTNPRQLGEKENGNIDESNWMVINCLHIISPQAVSRVTQTTPRHLPDTFQTPYRHPNNGMFFTNPRQLGDKKPANRDQSIGCSSIACTSCPTDSIQSHSDNPQTPPRHIPDTLQTPKIQHIFYQSKATRRQETS